MWSDFHHRTGFQLTGETAAGGHFECILSGNFASLKSGGKTFLQQFDQDPQDEPPGSGGLLVALNQLRLLLTQRDKAFGSLAYFGTEPLDGGGEQVDVLVSTLGSVECRWYFSVAGRSLVGFDTHSRTTRIPAKFVSAKSAPSKGSVSRPRSSCATATAILPSSASWVLRIGSEQ